MRHLVAGTAGHIDHGKSELVRALTGTDPDRLKEERERGITIDIGFAHLELDDSRIAFVDVPGHERFVKNMLAGACGIDMVVLVIAADESVMPQTREHFDICRLLGVRAGLTALTKTDLVEPEVLEIARMEVREFLSDSFLQEAPVVPVSARTGDGLDALRGALGEVAGRVPLRADGGLFRLPVDRCFSVRGFGTVVTGTLIQGALGEGDEVEVLPSGERGRVRGLEVHNRPVARAVAGQRTAVNLQGIEREALERGRVLVHPGTLAGTRMLDARIEVLPDSPVPVEDMMRTRFHAGTSEILARVRTPDGGPVAPGAAGFVQLRLESPAVAVPGDRFILRRYSPARTIAGGVLLDTAPPKLRRAVAPAAAARLGRLVEGGLEERLAVFAESAGEPGAAVAELARRCGATAEEVRAALERLAGRGTVALLQADPPRAVSTAALDALAGRAETVLGGFHRREPLRAGLPREELRGRVLKDCPPEVFRATLDRLSGAGRVRIERDLVALASHRVELGEEERRLRERLETTLRGAGLDPPSLEQLLAVDGAARGRAERILHLLVKEGVLSRLPDGRLIHAQALGELRQRLYQFRRTSEIIDIAAFKDLAGVSRKNAIPLLEHFDAERITVRRGNERLILPER